MTAEELESFRALLESLPPEQRVVVINGCCASCGESGGCWCDYDSHLE
jgi:Ni,Fe-hydrogenase III small subunit